ncbi:MAG: type IV pili methyl-accepting chemotaxis transducer N-terminal domain-containing protein [Gammaproteobacteria bacterium]|nr:type IV pili methyl-accepting chemotaxis transducer N-terminal domain-containing protein [Gammaproteobacteria bacterium]
MLNTLVESALRSIGLRTLNQQFLFSYGLIFLLALTAGFSLYQALAVSPETINVAGAQRMLAQRMAKEALLIASGAEKPDALRATLTRFETVHQDLQKGNPERNISVIETPEILAQMAKVTAHWESLKRVLEGVIQSSSVDDPAALNAQVQSLFSAMNDLAGLKAAHMDAHQRRLLLLASGCVLGIVLLVILGQQFGLKPMMRSLRQVVAALHQSGGGDFTGRLHARHEDNEMGQIMASYNQMCTQICTLVAQVRQTERLVTQHVQGVMGP